jgi:hypothetical protein
MHLRANPDNSSEILMVGGFDTGVNVECGEIGWDAGIEIALPWNVNNFQTTPQIFTGENGFVYTITGTTFSNGTSIGIMNINQHSLGGGKVCTIELINKVQAWDGPWKVSAGCGDSEYCCCPEDGSSVFFSPGTTNTTMSVQGTFCNNSICNAMGWSSGSATFPWGDSQFDMDNHDHTIYYDSNGVMYNVTITESLELFFHAQISTNQFTMGGALNCSFTLDQQNIHARKIQN